MPYDIIKTINKDSEAVLIEKKSKFICNIFSIKTKENAQQKIKEIKKKYYDAKHHCFAFSVIEDGQKITRMNDDGEPSGTAGEPILNIILKNQLENVLIIVTRYFGGILLGTGGLTRAYSNSSLMALKNTQIVTKQKGILAKIELNYIDNEKFKYYCSKNDIRIINSEYNENIVYTIELNNMQMNNLHNFQNGEKKYKIISFVKICQKYI